MRRINPRGKESQCYICFWCSLSVFFLVVVFRCSVVAVGSRSLLSALRWLLVVAVGSPSQSFLFSSCLPFPFILSSPSPSYPSPVTPPLPFVSTTQPHVAYGWLHSAGQQC